MRIIMVALCVFGIVVHEPRSCSRVTSTMSLLDGRYALVTCPESTFQVVLLPQQPMPTGAAFVLRDPGLLIAGGVYTIIGE